MISLRWADTYVHADWIVPHSVSSGFTMAIPRGFLLPATFICINSIYSFLSVVMGIVYNNEAVQVSAVTGKCGHAIQKYVCTYVCNS